MIPVHSELRIKIVSEDEVVLITPGARRILYGGLSILLTAASAVSLDPAVDFSGSGLIGTILIFLLILLLVYGAGKSTSIRFLKKEDRISRTVSFFAMLLCSRELLALSEVKSLDLVEIVLLKGGNPSRDRNGLTKGQGFFQKRTRLYQLSLESTEKRIMLQESSGKEEIAASSRVLSTFLGVEVSYAAE